MWKSIGTETLDDGNLQRQMLEHSESQLQSSDHGDDQTGERKGQQGSNARGGSNKSESTCCLKNTYRVFFSLGLPLKVPRTKK